MYTLISGILTDIVINTFSIILKFPHMAAYFPFDYAYGSNTIESLKDINRHEKSLGLLTEKFVQLLKEAPDGILDIKAVIL